MWAIRLLNGPQAGKIIPLKSGRNIIGRNSHADIQIASPGISKEHAAIEVRNGKVLIADLKSSNGTYVNGVRIQAAQTKVGDKLSLHDVLFDFVLIPESQALVSVSSQMPQIATDHPVMQQQHHHAMSNEMPQATMQKPVATDLKSKIKEYIDQVALPGVYKLSEVAEFKFVLAGFIFVFIFTVTLLSMLPMSQITQASIEKESRRRALSIARNMAQVNQQIFATGLESNLTTQNAQVEDGISEAVIISQVDGMILAPAEKAGSSPDLPFVHTARRETKEMVVQIDSKTIGASVPIAAFNPDLGAFTVKAHAIVIYDMGSLAFDDGRAFSLFIQTLVISCLIGGLIFFFMYKLIEYPIVQLNAQLDKALRDKEDNITTQIQFPAYIGLLSNVNSLLSRYVNGDQNSSGNMHLNRDQEAYNLLHLVGYPCIAINKYYQVIGLNPAFEQLTGASAHKVQNQEMSHLPDQALQKNIGELLDISKMNPSTLATSSLEFGGDSYIVSCQCFMGPDHQPEYYLVTISPSVESLGGAA